jgi:hypothetical protein
MKNRFPRLAVLGVLVAVGLTWADRAPVLSPNKDVDGKPLPFGRRPHQPNDTPLGTGPFKAIMAEDPSLPDHTLYYPANIGAAGKLPVITWGNGACLNAGNRFRDFLTEIASHGFLVISGGPIANTKYEVGPQENPAVPPRGPTSPANAGQRATPTPSAPPAPGDAVGRNTVPQLIAALDWAEKVSKDASSKFYDKLDTSKMGVAGQSCGGSLAATVAADPRIKAAALFSGAPAGPLVGNNANVAQQPTAKSPLEGIHSPLLLIAGDASHDVAHQRTLDAAVITKVPVFLAWQDNLTHIGTYGMPNGGELGRIGSQWFALQLRGDKQAAKTFQGNDCGLCKETGDGWHVTKKLID